MLIAVLLSAAILVKSYWAKLKSFFAKLSSRQRGMGTEDKAGDSPGHDVSTT
jgi:hypothetical protein